ncbi:MAG: V-type ATP synthase subunit F [Candidatus Omnitrophica bacterium]|nr:V-type ATP synthase subunit F [Candidatus Omnitrophota bacterium]
MKFFCIADIDSALGFKLVGVETRIVQNKEEAQEALRLAKITPGVGIILITSKVAEMIPDLLKIRIKDEPMPLVLEIPSRGQIKKQPSVAVLLKELAGANL